VTAVEATVYEPAMTRTLHCFMLVYDAWSSFSNGDMVVLTPSQRAHRTVYTPTTGTCTPNQVHPVSVRVALFTLACLDAWEAGGCTPRMPRTDHRRVSQ
jgi:hypothetical protein